MVYVDLELEIVYATRCGVCGCGNTNDDGPPILALSDVGGTIEEVPVKVCASHRTALTGPPVVLH